MSWTVLGDTSGECVSHENYLANSFYCLSAFSKMVPQDAGSCLEESENVVLTLRMKKIRISSSLTELVLSQPPFLWSFLLGKGHTLAGRFITPVSIPDRLESWEVLHKK